ncbi:MAG: phospholipase D-like domain-containing protein, partial [Bacillota bacterium]
TDNKIQIKWYLTHGEQYHSKIIGIYKKDKVTLIGGSANFTRRNIDNYNLEADLMVTIKQNDPLANDFKDYFNRIWSNQDGVYTADYSEYEDDSIWKTVVYRLQEKTGLCTF